MTVMLDKLKYRSFWTSRLGALKGCMDYLGKKYSAPWLFGASGHAFVLNVAADSCTSGPTAWNCDMITHLTHNLGVSIQVVNSWKTESDFAVKQKIAWENTKQALDKGYPCYGWELGIPEFYVICGYDEHGYYYKGIGTPTFCFAAEQALYDDLLRGVLGEQLRQVFATNGIDMSGEAAVILHPAGYATIRAAGSEDEYSAYPHMNGRLEIHDDFIRPSEGFKPWQELGTSSIGWLHAGWLEQGAQSDDFTIVMEGLEFALEFAQSPAKWVMPGYRAGLDGYDNWLKALQADNLSDPTGLAYNGEVWAECRTMAELFLKEASERIGGEAGKLLLAAAEPYGEVAAALNQYRTLLPFFGRSPELLQDAERMGAAIQAVQTARKAEAAGLEALAAAYACMERA